MLTNISVERLDQRRLRGHFICHLEQQLHRACFVLLASFFPGLDTGYIFFPLFFFLHITFILISLQTSNNVYDLPLSHITVLLLFSFSLQTGAAR